MTESSTIHLPVARPDRAIAGNTIHAMRKSMDLTQADLAERAGISRSSISRVEHDGSAVDSRYWAIVGALAERLAEGDPRALISVSEAADMLGIKAWPCYQLLESGEIPSGYIGKRRKVRPEDVRAYAERLVAGEVQA
jgi:excisionase family DNA binding protein